MAVQIKLNSASIRDLLRSDGVLADLRRRAEAIAEVAGEGHEVDSEVGPNRARASVRTATRKAAELEAKDRNLTRAFDAGRH